MSDAAWRDLDEELDRWAAMGRRPSLWLRDDDAIDITDALERLLALADQTRTPLALAVIPAAATPALARRLARAKAVSILQHGYAHANHAPLGEKKSEFADQRPLETMMGELVRGRTAIFRMFGAAATAVLAPPWNRMTPALEPILAAAGLAGLSRFKPRARPSVAAGVLEANAHVDLIAWRTGRIGKPATTIAAEISAHLASRRLGAVDRDEPTGVLTHHLAMDAGAWTSLESLLTRLGRDPRVDWLGAPDIFHSARPGTPA